MLRLPDSIPSFDRHQVSELPLIDYVSQSCPFVIDQQSHFSSHAGDFETVIRCSPTTAGFALAEPDLQKTSGPPDISHIAADSGDSPWPDEQHPAHMVTKGHEIPHSFSAVESFGSSCILNRSFSQLHCDSVSSLSSCTVASNRPSSSAAYQQLSFEHGLFYAQHGRKSEKTKHHAKSRFKTLTTELPSCNKRLS